MKNIHKVRVIMFNLKAIEEAIKKSKLEQNRKIFNTYYYAPKKYWLESDLFTKEEIEKSKDNDGYLGILGGVECGVWEHTKEYKEFRKEQLEDIAKRDKNPIKTFAKSKG